jgi:hypothetical protein
MPMQMEMKSVVIVEDFELEDRYNPEEADLRNSCLVEAQLSKEKGLRYLMDRIARILI